jgi:hypothetical protein
MYIQIFQLFGVRKSGLLHKPESHVYVCYTTPLFGPLSAIIGAGIVQVIYG